MGHMLPVCERLGAVGRFEGSFYFAGAGMAMADGTGRLVEINQAFADLLGRPKAGLVGRNLADLFDTSAYDPISEAVVRLGAAGGSGPEAFRIDVRYKHADGSGRWAMLTLTQLVDDASPCIVIVGIDITWRRELRTQLYNEARHDPLTGLPNRTYLQERLDHVLSDPTRSIGACLADLDGFKQVNDLYGHGIGDRLLTSIAEGLRGGSVGHVVGRVGGDEFLCLIIDPLGLDELKDVATNMLDECSREFRIDGHRLAVSASIGIAMPDPTLTTLDTIIRAADGGLYDAKSGGRGRWRVTS